MYELAARMLLGQMIKHFADLPGRAILDLRIEVGKQLVLKEQLKVVCEVDCEPQHQLS